MPWCWSPALPAVPFWSPQNDCPPGTITTPVQPGTSGGNIINQGAGAVGGAVSSGVQAGVNQAIGTNFQSAGKAFDWFSGTSGADHWKGVGLILAATVLGIVGLVLWTGKGGDAVKVSTTTGARIATA